MQAMTELADRVFCFYEGQAKERVKSNLKKQGAQATLEAYSWDGCGSKGRSSVGPGMWSILGS
jgi:hypothetical protein